MRRAAELKLEIGLKNGKSVITDSYFTSPIKLGVPRVPADGGAAERDRLQVMLMMASAGILKGDGFHYDIKCGAGTRTLITEQSYTKLFDMGEGGAWKEQKIVLEGNASLFYFPSPVIPFHGSRFQTTTEVELAVDSEFAFSDIVTAGRVGMGEAFAFARYRSRICVKEDGKTVWIDNCLLEPERMDLRNMLFFGDYTHMGTFYYHGSREREQSLMELAGGLNREKIMTGVSETCSGVLVRALAHTAQEIEEVFGLFLAGVY